MVDPITMRTWIYRGVFTLIVLSLAFLQLLPLSAGSTRLPAPDLILAVTLAWVVRRPAYVPLPLIAVLYLFLDLLLQRPPGLMTALVVLGSELLRSRRRTARAFPFLVEWTLVSGVMIGITALYQIALAVALLDTPPLGLALMRAFFTAAVYPVVVAVSHYGFGVTAARPDEADALGDRL